MTAFKAYRITQLEKGVEADFVSMTVDQLTEGDVVVKVEWSGINYKDALAATGKGKILRKPALNGGIDLAGVVISSDSPKFAEGDRVVLCGGSLSETLDGGFSETARVPSAILTKLPDAISTRDAMAIGTAGFTAALAVDRMQANGQTPVHGPILVTGASGGVGSVAINLLSDLGYDVIAMTSQTSQLDYFKQLGASDILDRTQLEMGERPLEKATWGGAVDNVGGDTLGWLTRTVVPWGTIASVGLAGGFTLNTTVMPFILRGVALLGINSIEMPQTLREHIWSRLASDLKVSKLAQIVTEEVAFDALPQTLQSHLGRAAVGRTLVKISG